jgi:hypothetical protein
LHNTFAALGQAFQPVTGPSVWTGNELAACDDWRFELIDTIRAEIRANLENPAVRGLPYADLDQSNFPLPSFAAIGRIHATSHLRVCH